MAFSHIIMFWETDSSTVFWDKEQVIFLEFQRIKLCLKFLCHWKIPSYIFLYFLELTDQILLCSCQLLKSFLSLLSSLLSHTQCFLPVYWLIQQLFSQCSWTTRLAVTSCLPKNTGSKRNQLNVEVCTLSPSSRSDQLFPKGCTEVGVCLSSALQGVQLHIVGHRQACDFPSSSGRHGGFPVLVPLAR